MKRAAVPSRRVDFKFAARGLCSRNSARLSGQYVDADVVVGRLEKMLAQAKRASKARK